MSLEAFPAGTPLLRLSVAQYHAMREAGILGEDDRVELLEGLLIPKMTKKPPHALATRLARMELEGVVPSGYFVDSQEPVTTDDSEPEPDVAVIRGSPRDYATRHPGPGDVALVVEIADNSVERDRSKERLYARAGIPAYWIVNLRSGRVELHLEPDEQGYARREERPPGSTLDVVIEGAVVGRIAVERLLP